MKTRILILLAATYLLTGCLTSPNPFYTDAQVFQDDRILGDYRDPKTQEGALVERDMDHERRYMIRCFEGKNGRYWIWYVATLFKFGGVTYLDLYHEVDAGVY